MTGLVGMIRSQSYGCGSDGGDVYYFTSCASGRISRVLLADVSGHGESVAKTGAALRDIMRRNVNVIRQQTLMKAINAEFGTITREGGFATAVVVTHFSPTRTITISSAGHPPPLFYSASRKRWSLVTGESAAERSNPKDLPLGIVEAVNYSSMTLPVGPSDLLVLYTDAFSEARNRDGKLMGSEGLIEILNGEEISDRDRVIPFLTQRLKSVSAGNLVDDDATIITLEPTGRRIPMRNNLLAPWRMLLGVDDTIQDSSEPTS